MKITRVFSIRDIGIRKKSIILYLSDTDDISLFFQASPLHCNESCIEVDSSTPHSLLKMKISFLKHPSYRIGVKKVEEKISRIQEYVVSGWGETKKIEVPTEVGESLRDYLEVTAIFKIIEKKEKRKKRGKKEKKNVFEQVEEIRENEGGCYFVVLASHHCSGVSNKFVLQISHSQYKFIKKEDVFKMRLT